MSFLAEHLWIWLGLGLLIAAIGGTVFLNNRDLKTLGITLLAAVVPVGIGLLLFFCVDTDQKSITRMLTALTAAIEADDLEKVETFLSPKAVSTVSKAKTYMGIVKVSSAKFFDLKVEVNRMLTPPIAKVRFVAVVHYETKSVKSFDGLGAGFSSVQRLVFNVELEKTNNSWLVTDKCEFTPSATGG